MCVCGKNAKMCVLRVHMLLLFVVCLLDRAVRFGFAEASVLMIEENEPHTNHVHFHFVIQAQGLNLKLYQQRDRVK